MASLVLALLVSFAWRFLVSLAAFWTQDAIGLGRAAWALNIFLSGFIMPNAFLPDWLRTLTQATPFPSMINTPIEIYLGVLDRSALLGALAAQLAWFLILYLAAQIVLASGVRKLVIQGG
jgi:ABC-2 type transport system permease protein